MDTQRMGEIYGEMANTLNEMIPVEWSELYLYGEFIENESKGTYFYFKPQDSDEFEQGLFIPENYNVDKNVFNQFISELYISFEELYREYKDNNPEVWSNFTLYLNTNGNFKIDFDYDDVLKKSMMDSRIIWEYKYLNMYPTNKYDIKVVDEYIKSQKNNEI